MQLSKKLKVLILEFITFQFLFAFLKSTSYSKYCETKDNPHSLSIYNIIDLKRRGNLNV